MNGTIMIKRKRVDADAASLQSQPTQLCGADAMRILASVENISDIEIQSQQGDRVVLSFASSAPRVDFEQVDVVLQANGLQRLV